MKRLFNSLTFKIGFIIILVEIITLTVIGFSYVQIFNNGIEERLKHNVALPGNLIKNNLLAFARAIDEETVEGLVGEELIEGMVVKTDGEVLLSTNVQDQKRYISELPRLDRDWFKENTTDSIILEMPDGIASVTPVPILPTMEKTRFFIYIKVSTEKADREKAKVIMVFVGLSLATVLITSMVIILLFYSVITVRMNKLLGILRRVKAGDLGARVEVPISLDEIGILQSDVNLMASQLQRTIETLENQIVERTRGLETVVEISQRLTSILDLSDLLHEVVTIIKETFDYYHVHIYLLEAEILILAEGYGQVGAEMKRQGHSIPLSTPQSLVARAARNKQIITVEDTRNDPGWLPNPLLPDTHSEMVIPVMSGGEVAGVLDVQSERVGGLTQEDETLLQALANQVAVAVRNARAFDQTQAALDEAQRLQRLYTGQAWEKFSAFRPTTNYEIRQPALPPLQQITTPEALTALQHKQTVDLRIGGSGGNSSDVSSGDDTDQIKTSADGFDSSVVETTEPVAKIAGTETESKFESALATPLRLGDEIIGVLGIRDDDPDRRWTEEEIMLIEAVSEQMSLAIENARLFEETGRRASRERVIAEVTRRIWASGELEQVMQTAVEQLGTTLDASKVIIRLGTEDQLTQKQE